MTCVTATCVPHLSTTDGKENGPLVARVIHFLVKLVHGSEELVLVARLHNGSQQLQE